MHRDRRFGAFLGTFPQSALRVKESWNQRRMPWKNTLSILDIATVQIELPDNEVDLIARQYCSRVR